MIILNDVLELHEKSIIDFGGSQGIRDIGLLESALARPFQTFGGEDLYPTIFEKTAALGQSLIVNHPFIDGNKRTGMLCMTAFLMFKQYKFIASSLDFYNFIIQISTGSISFEEMVDWLKTNTTPL